MKRQLIRTNAAKKPGVALTLERLRDERLTYHGLADDDLRSITGGGIDIFVNGVLVQPCQVRSKL